MILAPEYPDLLTYLLTYLLIEWCIFNDLEWPLTHISRARHNRRYLTLNISETIQYRHLVTTDGPLIESDMWPVKFRSIDLLDLCIRLTWNLTGSCGHQQRLRGLSRMVDSRHFENRYIAISQWKIIRFRWNFVHSSRFWTGWTSRDQKWKSCIRQTPSSTEYILLLGYCYYYDFVACISAAALNELRN